MQRGAAADSRASGEAGATSTPTISHLRPQAHARQQDSGHEVRKQVSALPARPPRTCTAASIMDHLRPNQLLIMSLTLAPTVMPVLGSARGREDCVTEVGGWQDGMQWRRGSG